MLPNVSYLKNLDNVDSFNISVVDRVKESKQERRGRYFTAVITYKKPFVINGQPVTVSLALGEGLAYNIIFSCPLLRKIKDLIITENNALISGILGD